MGTKRYLKAQQTILLANLIIGLMLLITGIVFIINDMQIIQNNKALVGLSFIPLAIALATFINLTLTKKKPESMRTVVIAQNDERIKAQKNEAEAKTFRILRWALSLVFLGYTFMKPADIFEAPGWWITFIFFFLSHALTAYFQIAFNAQQNTLD